MILCKSYYKEGDKMEEKLESNINEHIEKIKKRNYRSRKKKVSHTREVNNEQIK